MGSRVSESALLRELASTHFEEAMKCYKAGAYIAACVMLAANLEATLLEWVMRQPDEMEKLQRDKEAQKGKKKKGKKNPLSLHLDELITRSQEHGLLTSEQVSDLNLEVVVSLRNAAAHPGRWIWCSHSMSDFDREQVGKVARKVLDAHIDLVNTLTSSLPEETGTSRDPRREQNRDL